MTRDELLKVLDELAHQFALELGDKLYKVILYGSYARGDYTIHSDVDVMVLVDMDLMAIKRHRNKLYEICSDFDLKYDLLISLSIKNKDKFDEGIDSLPFYQNIDKEGVVIYD